jgi:poly-gamma-glutamate synthesis protein (capsule biosynthesis protein)
MAKKTPKPQEAVVAFTGDIMMGRRMEPFLEKYGFDYPFKFVDCELSGCDIVFGNSEAPIVYKERIKDLKINPGKSIYLYMEEKCAGAIKNAGYNVLSLANNHALDYNEDALLQTMEILDKNGIKYNGIYKGNLSRVNEPLIMKVNGMKIGFLCYSQVSPGSFFARGKSFGIIPADISIIRKDIRAAKPKIDLLVIYLHWGKEGNGVLKYQYAQARQIIDEGADILIGSHTHLFQDIELYNGKYIFYGLGNFVFDQDKESTKYSAIVKARIEKGKIAGVKVIPVYLDNYRPEIITDKEKLKIFWDKVNLINVEARDITDNYSGKL